MVLGVKYTKAVRSRLMIFIRLHSEWNKETVKANSLRNMSNFWFYTWFTAACWILKWFALLAPVRAQPDHADESLVPGDTLLSVTYHQKHFYTPFVPSRLVHKTKRRDYIVAPLIVEIWYAALISKSQHAKITLIILLQLAERKGCNNSSLVGPCNRFYQHDKLTHFCLVWCAASLHWQDNWTCACTYTYARTQTHSTFIYRKCNMKT